MVYTDSEQNALLALFTRFEGVSAAIDAVHVKGGYRVRCTIPEKTFDSLILELERNDWFSAM
ncbi:hypothetical protein [Massilia mucilaginosa]|uniref:hypothetical protein n=1 Tax=Massilia mucilaginosa TaxID=2609282 RepID=UPI001CB746EE|nr:hypothetical protein [Massilia mucilaginosa]